MSFILFIFSEGTWSDGKLTTRIGRNSGPVRYDCMIKQYSFDSIVMITSSILHHFTRFVLETLVKYGAPNKILVEG